MSGRRDEVLAQVADLLVAGDLPHPRRVGIDGVCAAGKSTFARDLRDVLEARGRPVVLVDSDGFHHVRARRHRQGRDSARGYYDDAYDLESVAEHVLRPLGPGGTRRFAERVHDLGSDAVVDDEWAVAAPDAVVLFAATFVQRGDLRELWDDVVFLDADEHEATERGVLRDAAALGGDDDARAAYASRYMAACLVYLDEQDPRGRASILVEHSDPQAPVLLRPGAGQPRPTTRTSDPS